MVVMDNFFTCVDLFETSLENGIYAMGMVRTNRVGLPNILRESKTFKKQPQGSLEWRMHEDQRMCAVLWKDKKSVSLIFIHSRPMAFPCEICEVPCRDGATKKKVKTSPVHLEYTTMMRGVDVTNHLRGNYTSQVQSHKWWHRLFFFVLDTTMTNMWIIHKEVLKRKGGKSNHSPILNSCCKCVDSRLLRTKGDRFSFDG